VRFELVSCGAGIFGVRAEVRITLPDFLQLFPNRTDGVVIGTPRDTAQREQWMLILRSRYGDISRIPKHVFIQPVPLVNTGNGMKVGLPF
jgi:hypothetical protein